LGDGVIGSRSGGDLDATADLNGYLAPGTNEANIAVD